MSNIDPAASANFLSLFSKLKHSADDRPDCLREWAKTDKGLRQLCDDVSWAAYLLAKSERSDWQLFTGPVDLVFIKTWRDYEERYEFALAEIFLDFLGPELVPGAGPAPKAYTRWEIADDTASGQAKAIETAIDFAIDQVADDLGEFPEGFLATIEEGARAWEGLKRETSFDLKGVFRRRELVPFILIPKHVSDKLGTDIGKLTLLTILQQAHDAFIFGAPLAALGLMRAVMEATLRDYYRASGGDLCDYINNARLLPPAANKATLHHLRELAIEVLHLDKTKYQKISKMKPFELEREIIRLLFALRVLIEGSPKARA